MSGVQIPYHPPEFPKKRALNRRAFVLPDVLSAQQEGLWFHGGNLHRSRHYSQFLSLQLKARMEGIPTPVWGRPETYHKS